MNTTRAAARRIAVVDDDPTCLELLQSELQDHGHEVLPFQDGTTALGALLGGEFDLVVSDLLMPGLDGIALCKALRDLSPGGRRLPILLVSALDDEDAIVAGLRAGADDFLVKPYHPNLLRAKVERLLAQAASGEPPQLSIVVPREHPADLPARFGPYVLVRRLGAGSFAVVYEARRLADGQPVAIKLFGPELQEDRELLSRFLREVTILTHTGAPHLVRFLASGYEDGLFYIATELLSGRSAAQVLKEEGPFPPQRALRLGAEVARALAGLHRLGILHRDVKPSNVMIGPDGRCTLIDLGLAMDVSQPALTSGSCVWGTGPYMAPEAVEGVRDDPASDLYSLGATLYHLLAGRTPYRGPPYEVLRQLQERVPPPGLDRLRPGLPAEVLELIADLMRPGRAERPASASAVAVRIERLLGQTAPEAPPTPVSARP